MNKRNCKNGTNLAVICLIFFAAIIILISGCGPKKKAEIVLGTMTVNAGDSDRINTIIRYQCLPADIFGDPAKFRREGFFHYIGDAADLSLLRNNHFVLVEEGGQKAKLDVQWAAESDFDWERVAGKGVLVWILNGKTPKGTKRIFKLVSKEGTPHERPFAIEEIDNKQLMVKYGDKPIFRYNYGVIHEKKGEAGPYDRAAYMHPVWTPSGKIITQDFSQEHNHHRGIFFAWKTLKFGDLETNFWNLGDEPGRKLPDELGPSIVEGHIFSELAVYNKGVYKGNTLMREVKVIRTYAVPEEKGWIFDIYVSQMPVDPENPKKIPTETTTATVIVDGKVKRITKGEEKSDLTMEILQYYYGGMTFRGTDEWQPNNASLDVLTSEGKTRIDGNHTEAHWVDFTGPFGSDWGGLVMFDHPLNQRYPTTVRIHPDFPYFCYNFANKEPYTVTESSPISLVYRFFAHDGKPNKDLNEQIANDFVNPPDIKWDILK